MPRRKKKKTEGKKEGFQPSLRRGLLNFALCTEDAALLWLPVSLLENLRHLSPGPRSALGWRMFYFSAASASAGVAFGPHRNPLRWNWWSWCFLPLLPVAGSHLEQKGEDGKRNSESLGASRRDLCSQKPQGSIFWPSHQSIPKVTERGLLLIKGGGTRYLTTTFFLSVFIKMRLYNTDTEWHFFEWRNSTEFPISRISHNSPWLPRASPSSLSLWNLFTYGHVGKTEDWCSRSQLIYNQ